MRLSKPYKVKWRVGEEVHLQPVASAEAARQRAQDLLREHGREARIEVWADDETWQVVAPAGIVARCEVPLVKD